MERVSAAPGQAEPSPSMVDVARHAGVALGTVSNVLNRPEKVSEATRRRVLKSIRELGFVRNRSARALAAGYTSTVGLLMLNIANSFFVDIARGAEAPLNAAGHPTLWANSDFDHERQDQYLRMFDEDRVSGVLLAPFDGPLDAVLDLRAHGRPVVLVNAQGPEDGLCTVSVDEREGGYLAASQLLDAGAERLLFVGGPWRLRALSNRLEGVQQAVAERGLELRVMETSGIGINQGREQAEAFLNTPERPDGIVCGNDPLAVGVIQAALTLGIAVPDELKVIGYDNNAFAAENLLPISTVSQPGREMGQIAAGLLLDEIRDPEGHEHQHVVLRPRLIARESSRPRPLTV